MLEAFTAEPIVKLKQQDKTKIESLLLHGDQLLVGLSTGSLRIYRVNNPPEHDEHDDESLLSSSDAPKESFKITELLREYEKFAKNKLEQLAVFKEANILISLSNGLISIHDLGTYELQEQLPSTKGATLFAATSNIVNDPSTNVPTLVSRLAVGVRRRILLWTWHDGEVFGDPQEFAMNSTVKCMTWAMDTKILVGLSSNYTMLDIETQDQKTVVGPGSIGGVPGQEKSAGTLSYIGMGSMVPNPHATGLGKNEMLLAKDVNTHFIDRDGEPIGRKQVPWRNAPQAVGYSYPYLLALQETGKGVLEVRNPETLTLLQSIELPNAKILQVPNPNISLAHQGKGFLVASERMVWRMKGLNYDAQIDVLLASGASDEAISLLEMIEETLIKDKKGRLREIKMQKAQILFDEGKFRDSLDLFGSVSAPPDRVIRLYPALIAGELAMEKQTVSPEASPKKKRRDSTLSKGSLRNSKKVDSDNASVTSGRTSIRRTGELGEKELKPAVRELQAYLADTRRKLQRFFNADRSIKNLNELLDDSSGQETREVLQHIVGVSDLDHSDTHEKLIEVARLVDTTLFRAHMFATPSLVGSLFRISNFCDPDVVIDRLEENGRYTDLIDFLYGKQLHRRALDQLKKFGLADKSDAPDSQLHGPRRTVTYLQNLPPDMIDLILEFSVWPMEADPDAAMQIFKADTENAESLPRAKVLKFLESIDKKYAIKYLEHLVDELNDLTPELHQRLAELYYEEIKDMQTGQAKRELVARLLTHLKESTQYSPAKVSSFLPRDDPDFYEVTAVVLSKMGQHRQALQIYVFRLKDTVKAEEYCNQVYLQESSNEEHLRTHHLTKKIAATNVNKDPTDEKPNIYAALLNLYLNPPKGEDARIRDAIELMARHGGRLPASSTLDLIPPDLLVRELEFYFRGRIRNANTIMNEARILANLRKVDAVRTQAKLMLGEETADGKGGRQRRVRIDDERACGVCYKRLGGSVISVFPDNSVVHLGCAARREKELIEGVA